MESAVLKDTRCDFPFTAWLEYFVSRVRHPEAHASGSCPRVTLVSYRRIECRPISTCSELSSPQQTARFPGSLHRGMLSSAALSTRGPRMLSAPLLLHHPVWVSQRSLQPRDCRADKPLAPREQPDGPVKASLSVPLLKQHAVRRDLPLL